MKLGQRGLSNARKERNHLNTTNSAAFRSRSAVSPRPSVTMMSNIPGPTDWPVSAVRAALINKPAFTPCSSEYSLRADSVAS